MKFPHYSHGMIALPHNSLAGRGIVGADFVLTLLTRHLPEHPGYFGEMVWILMMLEQWLAAKAPKFMTSLASPA